MPKRRGEYRICPICGNKFYSKPSIVKMGRGIYCSVKCRNKGQTKKNTTEVVCKQCGKVFKKHNSQIERGGNHFCSQKCFQKFFGNNQKKRKQKHSRGSKTRKGWILKLDNLWRKKVHERPDVCEFCGQKKNSYNAHHIKGRRHLSTRFDLNNAAKLCIGCHFKVHDSSVDNYNFMNKIRAERGDTWWDELQKKSNTIVKWNEQALEEVYNNLEQEVEKLEKH